MTAGGGKYRRDDDGTWRYVATGEPVPVRTAYHEAGHAVVDWVLDPERHPGSLSILPRAGADWAGIHNADGEHTLLEDTLCALFAGYAADVRFAPDFEEEARWGAADDDEKAERLLSLRIEGPKPDLSAERNRAAALVREHWELIARVAKELLVFGTLDDAELECILTGDHEELEVYRERNGDRLHPPRNARGPLA